MVSQEREQSTSVASRDFEYPHGEVNLTGDDSIDLLNEDDIDMATLLDENISSFENGQVITGTVLKVTSDDVVVDIGSKSEGLIPLQEFLDDDKDLKVFVGMDVDVMVVKREGPDGLPILSRRRAKQANARRHLREAFKEGLPVKCTIKSVVKGGFEVDVDSLRGFIPFSQMGPGARSKEEQDALLGQTIEAKILEMKNKRDLILSQRSLIDEKRKRLRSETMGALEAGRWFRGVVKNLTDFGAFIDLGGVDGLLHVKDMSWGHVAHPREKVSVGDEIEVMVLSIDGDRISLGLKQKTPDPWLSVTKKFPPGLEISGKVTSLTKYGAFVELEEGVEGLIHLSEMSWTKRVRHPSEMLKEVEEIKVKVLGIDEERKRISLSLRQTTVDPWTLAKANYPTGSVIEGEVTGMTDFGAFVRLPEGVDGMIHVSDMSWTEKVNHPKQLMKKGDVIRAKVLEIDPDQQRISLGLKQLEPDPWDSVAQRYKVGTVHQVKVLRLTEFGAFVELEEGIEALAPNSHLVSERGQRPEDVVRAGDIVTMKVIKLDRVNRKISLSLKDFVKEQERREVQQYMAGSSSGSATLGELLGEQMRALMNQGGETEEQPAADEQQQPEAEEQLASSEPEAVTPQVEEQTPSPESQPEAVTHEVEEQAASPEPEPEAVAPEEEEQAASPKADESERQEDAPVETQQASPQEDDGFQEGIGATEQPEEEKSEEEKPS